MTNIIHPHGDRRPAADARPVFSRLSTALGDEDRAELQRHLRRVEGLRQPAWAMLAHVLRHKIMTAQRLTGPAPAGLVTGDSEVTYMVSGSMAETACLLHWPGTDATEGVTAVASLLGATLIGMSERQCAPLPRQDGTVVTVSVLRTVPLSLSRADARATHPTCPPDGLPSQGRQP